MKQEFPKVIYVIRYDERLSSFEDRDTHFAEGEKVAIYELKEVKTAKVTRTLE